MIALGLKQELIMDDRLLLHLYHRLFDRCKATRPPRCVYDDAITALQALTASGVWAAMLADAYNKPQINPNNMLDKKLACVGVATG